VKKKENIGKNRTLDSLPSSRSLAANTFVIWILQNNAQFLNVNVNGVAIDS